MSIGRKIIFVIALMVFVGSGGALLLHYLEGAREQKALEELIPADNGGNKYAELYEKNHDLVGWIKIDGTKVDYPVMQTKDDPEFYLRRNFQKEYAISGVPFLDAKSDIGLPTNNWLIYGHHMNNGTMFHNILKYEKEDFFKTHKTFHFDTIDANGYEEGEYEVVAAFFSQIYPESEKRFKYYTFAAMASEDEYKEYVDNIIRLSQYTTGVEPKYPDQLITLSTCSYHVPDKKGRFAVVGRRIN